MTVSWTYILKRGSILLLVVMGLLVLDLYTTQWVLEDPGPYVVARHSDTPAQVIEALENLRSEPDLTARQLDPLILRYKEHVADTTAPPGRRKAWKRALEKARELRSHRSGHKTRDS